MPSDEEYKLAQHIQLNKRVKHASQKYERQEGEEELKPITLDLSKYASPLASLECDGAVFDDLDKPYGDAVSEKGIAVMKLVEKVTAASEIRDRKERDIVMLRAKVNQYKRDFELLNSRMLQDKTDLFDQLELLRKENEALKDLVVMREKFENNAAKRAFSSIKEKIIPSKTNDNNVKHLKRSRTLNQSEGRSFKRTLTAIF